MRRRISQFVFVAFVLLSVFLHETDAQEGQYCRTPSNDIGTCINIKSCDSLLQLLVSQSNNPQVRTFLLRSTCGYFGSTPLVCCQRGGRQLPNGNGNGNQQRPTVATRPPVPIVTPSTSSPLVLPSPRPNQGTQQITLGRPLECGYSNISSGRIVGGSPAAKGEFPWIAALGYRNAKNAASPKWLCGGNLITTRHVLTAGHCVHKRQDLYIVRLGEIDLYSDDDGANPVTIPIQKSKIHEDYSPSSFTNDIAILTLEFAPNIPGVWPICLPLDEPYRSNPFERKSPFVAGWGSLYFNGPSSATLQKVQLPTVTVEQCKNAFANFKTTVIDDRVLCAGYTQGGKDSCQGDSGGPLMLAVSNEAGYNVFYQIGVVSYGFRCAEAGFPGVYSRVTYFLDWITRNLDYV